MICDIGSSAKSMENEFYFYVDVVGGCNLKCPSCPVGNSRNVSRPKGVMSAALLGRIIKKAVAECKVMGVGFYNWTEPLLNPNLSELVRIVRSYGIPCSISTNLSVRKDFDSLLASCPEAIYVTVSGFFQDIYERTHKGGNIELVKQNMKLLVAAKKKYSSASVLTVIFLRYKGNQQDEDLMRSFSENLGFCFMPLNARMLPLEKILAYVDNDPTGIRLTEDDYDLMDLLVPPLDEAMAIARQNKDLVCTSLTQQFSINVHGEVELCCNVYDSSKYTICNYLEMPINEIQNLRTSNQMCFKCTAQGAHVYFGPIDVTEF